MVFRFSVIHLYNASGGKKYLQNTCNVLIKSFINQARKSNLPMSVFFYIFPINFHSVTPLRNAGET